MVQNIHRTVMLQRSPTSEIRVTLKIVARQVLLKISSHISDKINCKILVFRMFTDVILAVKKRTILLHNS